MGFRISNDPQNKIEHYKNRFKQEDRFIWSNVIVDNESDKSTCIKMDSVYKLGVSSQKKGNGLKIVHFDFWES